MNVRANPLQGLCDCAEEPSSEHRAKRKPFGFGQAGFPFPGIGRTLSQNWAPLGASGLGRANPHVYALTVLVY